VHACERERAKEKPDESISTCKKRSVKILIVHEA